MAINDISLTAGMRTNLTALQSTVSLLNRTQQRLSTGKAVNTALDNPLNFFTAQALNSRASDLSGFKDGMSEAVQTVTAANNGITGISALIQQAQAIAATAKTTSTATSNNNETLTISSTITAGDLVTVGGFTFTAVFTTGTAGTTQFQVAATSNETAANLNAAISAQAALSVGSLNNINVVGNANGSIITLQSSTTGLVATDVIATNNETFTISSALSVGDTVTVGGVTFTGVNTTSVSATQFDISSGTVTGQAQALINAINGYASVSSSAINDIQAFGTSPTSTAAVGGSFTLRSTSSAITTNTITDNATGNEILTISTTLTGGDAFTIGGVTFTAVATAAVAGTKQFNVGTGALTSGAIATNLATAIAQYAATYAGTMGGITSDLLNSGPGGAIKLLHSGTTAITDGTVTASGTLTGNYTEAVSGLVTESITSPTAAGAESAIGAGSSGDRLNYYTQYTGILSQIDLLAADSNYKGTNLLGGNSLDVTFGNSSTDKLTIAGFDGTSQGADLKMTATNQWLTNTAIDTDITAMTAATNTLKAKSSSLASGLSIVNTRQDWVNSMVNTLTQGADNLTLADMNEEGANMLMLNTRQSLGTTALSLSAQAAQSVLKLF